MNITKTKYEKILELTSIQDHDKNYYKVICIKNDIADNYNTDFLQNVKIYKYNYQNNYIFDKRSRRLDIVYHRNNKYHRLQIIKLNQFITKKTLKKIEKNNHHPDVCDMIMAIKKLNNDFKKNKEFTCVYIRINDEILDSYDDDVDICPDICFGIINTDELDMNEVVRGIKFKKYDGIDFDNMFDASMDIDYCMKSRNYKIDITNSRGQRYVYHSKYINDETSQSKYINEFKDMVKACRNFLNRTYMGTNVVKFGDSDYHTNNNYFVILTNNKTYMTVLYAIDETTCSSFCFELIVKVYDDLNTLFENLNKDFLPRCLNAIMSPDKNFIDENIRILKSDSEPDSDPDFTDSDDYTNFIDNVFVQK